MMESAMQWMTSTWINHVVLGYAWTWPTLETLHFLGLSLLMGTLIIMDLRLIGFERIIPLSAVHSLMPVAIFAFSINLITGLGFIFGDPHLYYGNWSFWAKMILVLLAGVNFVIYYLAVEPKLKTLAPTAATPAIAKAVGVASLLFWSGVLSFGRLLPYLGTGGG